jgi:cytochrome c
MFRAARKKIVRLRAAKRLVTLCAGALLAVCALAQGNLGRPVSNDELAKLDITILPDGSGLPAGSGTVADGAKLFVEKCQGCHGASGAGGPFDRLTGGVGSLTSERPVKTAISYWPSATTIFDYIRRAMPRNNPKSLSNDEVYAITAFLLSVDGIVAKDATLDAKSLTGVKMPNKDGFVAFWPRRK